MTFGVIDHWLGTRTEAGGTATLAAVHGFFVLRGPTDLIWRKGTPSEGMTGRTAPSSDGL